MKKNILHFFCSVLAGSLLFSSVPFQTAQGSIRNVQAGTVTVLAEDAVTVKNYDDFARALKNGKKNIIVAGSFTIRDKNLVETEGGLNGQMKPIEIPGGTVITGNGTGSISCSHPIQIMGDGVVIRDIEFVCNSGDALGSVPHREIFLAGHSLVLDNVSTYLKGSDQPNGINGTEKELLPTIYAGGYHGNNAIGKNASFTVRNANKNTVFQEIHLGNEASEGKRTAYTGAANLELDADAKVRGVISAENTASASINFLGEEDGVDKIDLTDLRGNANTIVTVENCAVSDVTTKDIKNIVLGEGGRLQPKDQTAKLDNITLKNGGCLDLTQVSDALITGDFTGVDSATKGKLVLARDGYVQIDGQVSGVTQFQVGSHVNPGTPLDKHDYIIAEHGEAGNFVFSEKDLNNGYSLIHKDTKWTAYSNYEAEDRELGSIEIKSYPHKVFARNIPYDIDKKSDNAPYLEIKWKDVDGNPYSSEDVLYYGFCYNVVAVRSEYWNSDNAQEKKDWSNKVHLDADSAAPDRYYLIGNKTEGGENIPVKTGEYTLLFLSSDSFDYPDTVEELKEELKDIVMKEVKIDFTDEEHTHTKGTPVRENEIKATCQTTGSYDEVVYCADSDCGYEMSRETKTSPVLDHVKGLPVIENRVEATVGKAGSYDEVIYCKKCKIELSKTKVEIPALEPEEPSTPENPGSNTPGTPENPGTNNPGTPENPGSNTPGTPGNSGSNTSGTPGNSGSNNSGTPENPGGNTPATPENPGADNPSTPETPGNDNPSIPEEPGTTTKPDTEKPGTDTENPGIDETTHKHSFILQETVDATCETEGAKIYSCTCGERYTEKIEKKSHTLEKQFKPAKIGKDGSISIVCGVCKTVLEQETIYAPKTIALLKENYIYDGTAKKPGIKLTDNQGTMIAGSSYKISYKNNKAVGIATVIVKFQENYTGTIKKTFEICPEGTSLTSVKAGKKSFLVKWKKQTSETSGYEIAYATDASFSKKNTTTMIMKVNKKSSKEIKGLKAGKKYYVKVRTYKEIKAGNKKERIYSDWSKKKSVQIKK